jgi:hypothetical protein
MQIYHIHKRLSFGGDITRPEDLTDLLTNGTTHIINCHREMNYASTRFTIWHAPTEDDGGNKEEDWFKSPVQFALSALATPGQKVHVHCLHGNNRSPSMCVAILLACGLALDDAVEMVRQARPEAGMRYRLDALRVVKKLGWQ